MSSGIESTSSTKAATSVIASKPKTTTITDQNSFAQKTKQSLSSSIVASNEVVKLANNSSVIAEQIANTPSANAETGSFLGETAEQVGGFFTGIGEVAYETGAGLASLGSSIAKTAYDLSPIEPVIDAAEWTAEKLTGQELQRSEWMPDSERGVERLQAGAEVVGAIVDDPGKLVDAVVDPIKQDWNAGRHGEAIGRGFAEVIGVVVGTKGIDKVAKGAKIAGAVDDVAKSSKTVGRHVDDVAGAGGKKITGARELENWDFEGAEEAYKVIRKTDDIADIAKHTGMKDFQVRRIKEHLFFKEHQLDDAVRRFDADPEITNSWQRLQNGSHTKKDIQLLNHELFESKFEGLFRTDYRTAHEAANRAGRPSGLE